MVVEPKTGYLLYSPFYVVPIEGALDGHSSHFSYYRRSPEGICSQLSTFYGEMGVFNHSKPCGWLEYQRLSELEHICARYKLDLTSDIAFWATTPLGKYHTCIYNIYILHVIRIFQDSLKYELFNACGALEARATVDTNHKIVSYVWEDVERNRNNNILIERVIG